MPVGVAFPDVLQVIGKPLAGSTGDGILKCWHGGDVSMSAMQLHWDIFCRVVDNYGDIGVCWRLARQLACEHARKVRLWVDDLDSLKPLFPTIDPVLQNQSCDGVYICQWIDSGFTVDGVADVVIEAFACELPPAYLQQMAINQPRPCWINLEYLTAEPW